MIDGGVSQSMSLSNGIELQVAGFKCEERATFLDYVFGGCEIGVHVAIDFTLSNGDPSKPNSLHSLHTGTNDYIRALQACLGILENYDDDKLFPVYGFGGKLPNS